MNTNKYSYAFSKYNPEWILRFEKYRNELREIFISYSYEINHVGSTSIPGISAKPVIDILISVPDVTNFPKDKLPSCGYQLIDTKISPNTLTFFKLNNLNEKMVNIHICKLNSKKDLSFKLMKKYLLENNDIAREYSHLKQENFNKYHDDYYAYRKAKNNFLKNLENKTFKYYLNKTIKI